MSQRVNQRWPDGLADRVAAVVGPREVTRFTVEAVERALEEASGNRVGSPAGSDAGEGTTVAADVASASPRESGKVEGGEPVSSPPSVPAPSGSKVPAVSAAVTGPIPKGKP